MSQKNKFLPQKGTPDKSLLYDKLWYNRETMRKCEREITFLQFHLQIKKNEIERLEKLLYPLIK
jgi:hypothetical protein